jgi:hypothetical protein
LKPRLLKLNILLRARADGVAVPSPFQFLGGGEDYYRIADDGGIHWPQITKIGNSLTFSIDENFDGVFVADGSHTINDPSFCAPWQGETNSRLFFGAISPINTFDDFRVYKPIPIPSTMLLIGCLVSSFLTANSKPAPLSINSGRGLKFRHGRIK